MTGVLQQLRWWQGGGGTKSSLASRPGSDKDPRAPAPAAAAGPQQPARAQAAPAAEDVLLSLPSDLYPAASLPECPE
ncbi:hypothetical protein MNEG_13536, partial [Monoraphidium neglectum]